MNTGYYHCEVCILALVEYNSHEMDTFSASEERADVDRCKTQDTIDLKVILLPYIMHIKYIIWMVVNEKNI